MKVTDLFVKCLENEGVQYIFGVPGEENEDFLFSLEGSSIQFIPCRHELGAAFMANVWGRVTGRAGVCLATLGPGATNLITGVADANMDKAPLVALTAQGGITRLHQESHQYLDIVHMFGPITKWNSAISSPEVVCEVIRKAFRAAQAEKPGATQIELSEDLARVEAKQRVVPLPARRVRRPAPDYKAIDRTIERLEQARRPLVIAGNGAIRKRASKHLTAFVQRHGIPVATTFMGKGAVSDELPQSLMSIGLGFVRDYVQEAVDAADLIITVGYDIAEFQPEKWNPDRKKIVHIDFIPAEVYTHYEVDVEVVGDISGTIWELDQKLGGSDLGFDREWYAPIRQRILESHERCRLEEGQPFTIPGALHEIRDVLDPHGLLISDVGSHKMWIGRNFPTCCPGGCIISNGLASMGIALPGAVAAALAEPGRQVVAVMGDGGFMMNSQELETAKRLGVGFTAIIFNDNDYGLISWKQRLSRGRSIFTRLDNPDFKAYVESFGIKAYRPESPAELRETLRETIPSGKLSVVEIPVDPSINDVMVESLNRYWRNER